MKAMRVAGWGCAAALVLGGHGAAALWVMHTRTNPPPPPGQPIFVDLAPPGPAPDFSVPKSGLALSGPPTIPPAPPPDFAMPPPLIETAQAIPPAIEMPPIEPLSAFDAAVLPPPSVSAERPMARPQRSEPPGEPEPAREAPRKTVKADRRPQPQKAETLPAGNRATASEAAARSAAQTSWRAAASAAVARLMQRGRYSTRGPISATISLTVDGAGRITSANASSGSDGTLDATLTRQIRRLGRLPAPPGGGPLSVIVPVKIMR